MKKLILVAVFLFSAPMVNATGIPCATCGVYEMINKANNVQKPVFVTLGTEIKSNTITPKEIILLDKESSCFYSGVLTKTISENNLIIDVNKKVCPTKTDKVDYSVLNIKANKNYSEGTQFQLYLEAEMTDVIKVMVNDLFYTAETMPAKGAAN